MSVRRFGIGVLTRQSRRCAPPHRSEGTAAGVVAGTDEREVVVGEPLEERRRFAHLLGIDGARRRSPELGGKLERAVAHRLPILDHDARTSAMTDSTAAAERVENRAVALAVDLGVHEQRAVDYGLEQHVHLVAVAREKCGHAVDDERQVVGDDEDDGVR